MRRCEKMWEDVRRCEKMWEDVRRCEKMWEDVRRCEKMWEDVRRWEDVLQTPTIGRSLRSDALGKKRKKKTLATHQIQPGTRPHYGQLYLSHVSWHKKKGRSINHHDESPCRHVGISWFHQYHQCSMVHTMKIIWGYHGHTGITLWYSTIKHSFTMFHHCLSGLILDILEEFNKSYSGYSATRNRKIPGNLSMGVVQKWQIPKWVCLKIGYIPNYSHLIGIMIINHWV